MDCVGCDKCRLWGKVQTTGLATALKVLFELDEMALKLAARLLALTFNLWIILVLKRIMIYCTAQKLLP